MDVPNAAFKKFEKGHISLGTGLFEKLYGYMQLILRHHTEYELVPSKDKRLHKNMEIDIQYIKKLQEVLQLLWK